MPNIKQQIQNVIKKCELCQRENRKNTIKGEFITTTRQFEKISLDLINTRKEGCYIMVGIDYFTRYIVTKILKEKTAGSICDTVKEWCVLGYIPETFIVDNTKQFINSEFREMYRSLEIEHHVAGIEDHRANERVERVIRTIRDGMFKLCDMSIEKKIPLITKTHNTTYHLGKKTSRMRYYKKPD